MILTFKNSQNTQNFLTTSLKTRLAIDDGQSADSLDNAKLSDADVLLFSNLSIAVIGSTVFEQMEDFFDFETATIKENAINIGISIEHEVIHFSQNHEHSFLRGFRVALDAIENNLFPHDDSISATSSRVHEHDVWGLKVTKVDKSKKSGKNVKIAILDTGFYFDHPDFKGRSLSRVSFVQGEPKAKDLKGHGTHVAGISGGPLTPVNKKTRYGIAYESHLYICKVLNKEGEGVTAEILQGINWALENKIDIINMSLNNKDPDPSPAYTQAGNKALAQSCIIIASAGNSNSQTEQPANSKSIMSVSAINSDLEKASYSNYGKVDITAPGSEVFSSYIQPELYHIMSGTSMAAPYVTGIAALYAQDGKKGRELWKMLTEKAHNLGLDKKHQGTGLVQAPLA